MTLYLDTSVLVTALTNEPETSKIQAWLEAQDPDDLTISDWVITEFASAVARKLRTGELSEGTRSAVSAQFNRMTSESFAIAPVTATHFRSAARFLERYELGLRAGDALHLAVCADRGTTLCTRDHRLNDAGAILAIQTTLL